MAHQTEASNQVYPEYSNAEGAGNILCSTDWIMNHDHFTQQSASPSDTFLSQAPPSLQHFDVYQPYTLPLSVSPSSQQQHPHLDIDFGLLVPPVHYTSSPSPTNSSHVAAAGDQPTCAGSCSIGSIPSIQSSSPIDRLHQEPPSQQSHSHFKRSKTADHRSSSITHKTGSGSKAAKRHVQKRSINRPSPVFPSCSTPISMISQQFNPHLPSLAQTTSPIKTLVDPGPMPQAANRVTIGTDGNNRRSLSILTNHSTMQQLKDIESRILKLQAERGRLLKSAEDRSQLSGAQHLCPSQKYGPSINLYLSSVEQLREIENGLIEEGNSMMFKIGKLYSSLDSAIENTISLCSSGQSSINKLSECFPYINSLLLSEKETIKILECPNDANGLIQLELCRSPSSPHQQRVTPVPDSLLVVLETLNKIVHNSQLIQVHAREISLALKTIKCKLQEIRDKGLECSACSLETKLNAQAVLEGNLSVISAVQVIWEKTVQYGATTLTTITDSLT